MPTSTALPPVSSVTPTLEVARKRGTKPTKVNIIKLAVAAGGFETKKEAKESLQSAGFVATPTAVAELLSVAYHLRRARLDREHNRILKRLGHTPAGSGQRTNSTRPVLLPHGNPTQRVAAWRAKSVTDVAHSLFRHGAAGGHSVTVTFATNASSVDYGVQMLQNRDTYGGAYKGWAANEDHHNICIPKDWRLRVQRRGLATLGGLMTLDAHPLVPCGDVQVYAATWARQCRGYDVTVDRGYIAVLGSEHFHGDSADAAIQGVSRKVKAAGALRRTVASPYELTVEAFVKRYTGKNLLVSVSDAHESGACDFGIRSWCEAVGLDYDEGDAPLAHVLKGFQVRPQEEVRRAVVFAVRRHRAENKAVAA
jgi:hypothetical protein